MSRWFRFYDGALNDAKVQRLPAPLFKAWVNLLCLASMHDGVLPPVADISFSLRIPEKEQQRRSSCSSTPVLSTVKEMAITLIARIIGTGGNTKATFPASV